MSNLRVFRIAIGLIGAAVSVCVSHTAFAGGDLIAPPIKEWSPKQTWSGFYVGGGLGIQQLNADITVDANNHFKKVTSTKSCILKEVPSIIEEVVKVKKTKTVKKWVKPRCGVPYQVTKEKVYWEKEVQKKEIITTVETCTCQTNTQSDDFNFTHTESASSDWNLFGTVMIGLDRQLSSRVVGGIFADIDFGTSELDFGFSHSAGHNTANVSGNLKSDYSFTVGARLGYLLTDRTLAYGLIGYTRTSLSGMLNADILDDRAFMPDLSMSKKIDENVGGVTLGVGAEHKLTSNWSARLEYRYTWLSDIEAQLSGSATKDLGPNQCNINDYSSVMSEANVNIDPSIHSVRAVVTYKFDQ